MNNNEKLLDFGLSTKFYEKDVLSRQAMCNANYLKEVSNRSAGEYFLRF